MVQCPACGAVNAPGRKYCGGCAHVIGVSCPACCFVNDPGCRYCGGCAGELLALSVEPARGAEIRRSAPPGAPPASAPAPPAAGQRVELMGGLLDLEDLAQGMTAPNGERGPTIAADATQGDVDGFFRRLASEGVAELHPQVPPGQEPPKGRGTPS